MIAFLRRHCFLLAVAILLWQGWAASSASPATPTSDPSAPVPPPAPVLTLADFAQDLSGDAPLAPADPFFLRELLLRRAAISQDSAKPSTVKGGTDAPEEQALTPGLLLTLQSTLPAGAQGRAWINGQDLAINDAIPGIAAANPPVLKSVVGSTVTITWSGKDYLLDLYGVSAVELPIVNEVAQ